MEHFLIAQEGFSSKAFKSGVLYSEMQGCEKQPESAFWVHKDKPWKLLSLLFLFPIYFNGQVKNHWIYSMTTVI